MSLHRTRRKKISNDIIDQKAGEGRNYVQIDIGTGYHACSRRTESGLAIRKAPPYYHVKRGSLYGWLKRFGGTRISLADGSHRPKSPLI